MFLNEIQETRDRRKLTFSTEMPRSDEYIHNSDSDSSNDLIWNSNNNR